MTTDEIVDHAHALCERRVDQTKLNLRLELFLAIQELLHENRFWWAERTLRFNTVTGAPTYNLSAASVANRDDVEEILEVYNVSSSANPSFITPLLERKDQLTALEATIAAPPSSWMMDLGNWPFIRFGAPVDGVYPIRIIYHAGLNVKSAQSDVAVPLVPGPLHYGLVTALKRRIFNFLFGQTDPRFVVANQEYLAFVKNAARKRSFSAAQMQTFDTGDAIRAY